MIPAVIVCHGELGEAFVQALWGIYGNTDHIEAISNAGLSAAGLAERVRAALEPHEGPVILLSDYFGGSCANACLQEIVGRRGVYLISGVNLPVLIYYLTHRLQMSAPELVAGMLDRGRGSVRDLTPSQPDV